MSTETKTIKMGIAPRFSRFIAAQVRDGNHAFVMGTQDPDRDEREATFRNMAITYLIGETLTAEGKDDANINDYVLTLKRADEEDDS